jgi:predicted CoA-binding protein
MSIPQDVKQILQTCKKVAVIGISVNPSRPSNWIARYLIDHGFEVTGVNPGLPRIEGIRVVESLDKIEGPLEIVNVYRNSDAVPEVIEALKAKKPKIVWLQPGAENPEAEICAQTHGLKIISGRCIFQDHQQI